MEISKVSEEEHNLKDEDINQEFTPEISLSARKLTKRTSFSLSDEDHEIQNHLEFHIKAHDIDEIGEFTFAKHKISRIPLDEDQSTDYLFPDSQPSETVEATRIPERKRSIRFEDIPAHTDSSVEFVLKVHEF